MSPFPPSSGRPRRPSRSPGSHQRRPILPILLLAPILALGACGYHQGFPAKRLGVRTVCIHAVKNSTYVQGLDADLSRQLSRDLTQMTGLLPGTPRTSDAILEVELEEVHGRALSAGSQGSIREGTILLVCTARLTGRRSGGMISQSRHVDQGEFRMAVGETRATAYAETVRDLSRKILIAIGRNITSRKQ